MICDYCGKEVIGRSAGSHKIHCEKRPEELKQITKEKCSKASKGRKHSPETKKLISDRRKIFLAANPDMVPYKLNHKSKETYPETYFKECLPGFIYQYHIPDTLYHGDFVNPQEKIIIEIDGEQHYVDPNIVTHDIKRTSKLESLGWRIIRIRWSDFQKLDKCEKIDIVNKLNENKIEGFDMNTYVKPKKVGHCADCGTDIYYKATRCTKCVSLRQTKLKTTKDELITKIKELNNIEAVGRFFNVNGNTIRKHCKKLGIKYKIVNGNYEIL